MWKEAEQRKCRDKEQNNYDREMKHRVEQSTAMQRYEGE